MKNLLALAASLLVALSAKADPLTFTWDVYPHTNYTGYTLLYSKVFVAGAYRSDFTNWTGSFVINGRTTTNVTVSIPNTNLLGMTWFYLEATGPTIGTNVVFPSPLSFPVTSFRGTNQPNNFRAALEIQSATNLASFPIQWKTEQILPFEVPNNAEQKYIRGVLAIAQGQPTMPIIHPPPSP